MTKKQNAILSAYQKMLIECDNAPQSVAKITVFNMKITRVREIVAEIHSLAPQHIESTRGNTKAKNDLLEELVDLTEIVAGAIHSYAKEKGNTQLIEKVNYKHSKIKRSGQNNILDIAKVVLNNAKLVPAADLAKVGISAEDITEFADLITQISTIVPDNAVDEIEKTAIGKRIRALFAELADIKKNHLNRLSKQFIRKDPDFYYLYKTAMIVKYPSTKKKDTPETDSTATT